MISRKNISAASLNYTLLFCLYPYVCVLLLLLLHIRTSWILNWMPEKSLYWWRHLQGSSLLRFWRGKNWQWLTYRAFDKKKFAKLLIFNFFFLVKLLRNQLRKVDFFFVSDYTLLYFWLLPEIVTSSSIGMARVGYSRIYFKDYV